MNGLDPDELLDLASRLAVAAGDAALDSRRRRRPSVVTKSTVTDLVTEHDRAAEATIVAGLTAARPDDAIIGEEGTDRTGTSAIAWYLDPIDGTTNFVYGLPHWATSIAARDADGMVVGAVYAPVLGELHTAVRGGGAWRNGEPIACTDRSELGLALVATGFAYRAEVRVRQGAILARLLGAVRDIRRLGSAALDLCNLAAGRVDAYYELGLNSWDLAAGELIAREAGCRTAFLPDSPPGTHGVLAAAPAIFDELEQLLHRSSSVEHPT